MIGQRWKPSEKAYAKMKALQSASKRFFPHNVTLRSRTSNHCRIFHPQTKFSPTSGKCIQSLDYTVTYIFAGITEHHILNALYASDVVIKNTSKRENCNAFIEQWEFIGIDDMKHTAHNVSFGYNKKKNSQDFWNLLSYPSIYNTPLHF